MKNLTFKTLVDGNYQDVMKQFDRSLFEALAPPLVPFSILKFTGSQTGDTVHLKFGGILSVEWISKITDHGVNDMEAYFVDEGFKLPFPLAYWHHRHIVRKADENQSLIIDDITYKAANRLLTKVMYPILYNGFKNRKTVYRQYFGHSIQDSSPAIETQTS